MNYPSWWSNAQTKIDSRLSDFTQQLHDKILSIQPRLIMEKKPFLFRLRGYSNAAELAEKILTAFMSSSEETVIGNMLEGIAIDICEEARDGRKSSTSGIDLEYDSLGVRKLIQIKSSVKWGNSEAHKKLLDVFRKATQTVRQHKIEVDCIEGICYGPSRIKDKGTHFEIVGKYFWKEISDWEHAGLAVFDRVEHHAQNGMGEAMKATQTNIVDYLCRVNAAKTNGELDWNRLYELTMMDRRVRPR